MSEIKLQEIASRVFLKCQEIRLFYPLNQSHLLIQESDIKDNYNLKQIEIQSLPNDCWIFEHEFYQLSSSSNILQKDSFSNMGRRVEKSILWKNENIIYVFLVEMKTSLIPKKVAEYVEKVEHSLNTISLQLAVNQYFNKLENSILFPVSLLCYNHDDECVSSYFNDKAAHKILDSNANKRFKERYIELDERAFKMEIFSTALDWKSRIPFIFLKNETENANSFTINFSEIYDKLTKI